MQIYFNTMRLFWNQNVYDKVISNRAGKAFGGLTSKSWMYTI